MRTDFLKDIVLLIVTSVRRDVLTERNNRSMVKPWFLRLVFDLKHKKLKAKLNHKTTNRKTTKQSKRVSAKAKLVKPWFLSYKTPMKYGDFSLTKHGPENLLVLVLTVPVYGACIYDRWNGG